MAAAAELLYLDALPQRAEVSLLRLYLLRVAYAILTLGLGIFIWPAIVHHSNGLAATGGVRLSLLGGLGLIAALGQRYPLQMLPLLLFELLWKAIYLLFFALPLWRAGQITPGVAEDITSIAMVVIFLPLIPWSYVWSQYVRRPGARWW